MKIQLVDTLIDVNSILSIGDVREDEEGEYDDEDCSYDGVPYYVFTVQLINGKEINIVNYKSKKKLKLLREDLIKLWEPNQTEFPKLIFSNYK